MGEGIRVIGIEPIKERLNTLSKNMRDLTPIMSQIGNVIKNRIELSFEKQKSPFGEKWKQSYRAKKSGGITLTSSARLRHSFSVKADSSSVTVGTNIIYARIHQFGGTIQPKNKKALRFKIGSQWASKQSVTLPARPFMPIDANGQLESKTRDVIIAYLERKLLK